MAELALNNTHSLTPYTVYMQHMTNKPNNNKLDNEIHCTVYQIFME